MECAATLLPSTSEPWASAEIFPEEQNILPFSKGAKTLKSAENCPKVIHMFEKKPKNHKIDTLEGGKCPANATPWRRP